MKAPHIAITGIVAIFAFSAILVARALIDGPPGPWLTDENEAYQRAHDERKAIVIDFTAGYSMPSVELSKALDKLAGDLDRDFIRLRVDVTNQDEATNGILVRHGMTPSSAAVLFVEKNGLELGRVTQFVDEGTLRRAIADAARKRDR